MRGCDISIDGGVLVSVSEFPENAVPTATRRVTEAVFPSGTLATRVRGLLGPVFYDSDFVDLFSCTGRPAAAPGRLAMVMVLQYAENLSDRAAAEAVRARIDWKYLLGLDLEDPGFDFSVLSGFRARVVEGGAESRLLDLLLERCAEAGLIATRSQVRLDSTRVLAAGRQLNRMEFVGESLRAALEALAAAAPDWLARVYTGTQMKRYETPMDSWSFPRHDHARHQWLTTVGADGFTLLDAIDAAREDEAWIHRIPALMLLAEIWEQQYRRGPDGSVRWLEGKALPPARGRIVTPHDPEARTGAKRSSEWAGWKLHVAETCGDTDRPSLVCGVVTTAAAVNDVEVTTSVLDRCPEPATAYADMGYISIGEVCAAHDRDIDLIGPVRPSTSDKTLFSHDDFTIDWEQRTATCPAGRTSECWSTAAQRDIPVNHVRWTAQTCGPCELRSQCTTAKNTKWGRTLTLRDQRQHDTMQRLRQEQDTDEWRERYRLRAGVEGLMNQLVTRTGIRRSRYRGKAGTHLGHLLAAAGTNLIRIDAWSCGYKTAATRTSHLERLRHALPETSQ